MRVRKWVSWPVLLGLWAFLIAGIRMRGGWSEWFVLTVLTGVMLFAVLAPQLSLRRVEASRRLSDEVLQTGETLRIELNLRMDGILPVVWVAVREEMASLTDSAAEPVIYRRVLLPWMKREFAVHYQISPVRRGEWVFRHVVLEAGDLFGLVTKKIKVSCEAKVLVLPRPSADNSGIRLWNWGSGGAPGSFRSAQGIARAGISPRTGIQSGTGEERRPYVYGDSLRHLDWRSVAKGRSWQVRRQEREAASHCQIVLDGSTEAYGGNGVLFDACIIRALQVYEELLRHGADTRLYCSSTNPVELNGRGGKRNLAAAAVKLARARSDGGQSVAALIAGSVLKLPRGGSLIWITGGLDHWEDVQQLAAVRQCRAEVCW